jgi:hypothetical protein
MADTSLTGIIADFSAVLTTQLTAGATTAVISTNLTKAGETVPDGYYAFDLSKNESVEEHIVADFTSSTNTLSNIKRVSRLTGAVSGTGVANTHAKTATVTMVAFVPLARITDRLDGTTGLENVIKYADSAVQVPSTDEDIPHKKYVDDQDALTLPLAGGTMSGDINMGGNDINMATGGRVLNLTDAVDPQEPATLNQLTNSIAGAPPNASETVEGVVEEATQAEMDAGADTGATGAKLFVPPSKLQTYVAAEINQKALEYGDFILSQTFTGASAPADTVIAHGLSTAPFNIDINFAVVDSSGTTSLLTGSGFYTASAQAGFFADPSPLAVSSYTGKMIYFKENGTGGGIVYITGVVSVDATNITITWSQSGGLGSQTLSFMGHMKASATLA